MIRLGDPVHATGDSGAAMRPIGARQLGEKLASSRKCDIHAIDGDRVVKLYRLEVPLDEIREDARLSQLIHRAGLPVPGTQAVLVRTLEGRVGIVFDRVHGPLLSEQNVQEPRRIADFARLLADQHKLVHSVSNVDGLPSQKRVLATKLADGHGLSEREQEMVLALLARLPGGNVVCHGDFHLQNIILSEARPVIIDWGDATSGNRLGDVARTWLLMRFCVDRGWPTRLYCRLAAALYVRSYLRHSTCPKDEFAAWKLVQAAVRLRESPNNAERRRLLRYLRANLASLA